MLVLLDHASVHPLLQTGADFLFRHRTRCAGINAQQLEHDGGGTGEQAHKGFGGRCQPQHGSGDPACHPLRIQLANALGHQLAKNDGGEGDQCHYQGGRRNSGRLVGDAETMQPGSNTIAECGLTNDAVENTDRSNTDLHGRQELVRVTQQGERRLCTLVARLRHQIEPCFPACG